MQYCEDNNKIISQQVNKAGIRYTVYDLHTIDQMKQKYDL